MKINVKKSTTNSSDVTADEIEKISNPPAYDHLCEALSEHGPPQNQLTEYCYYKRCAENTGNESFPILHSSNFTEIHDYEMVVDCFQTLICDVYESPARHVDYGAVSF